MKKYLDIKKATAEPSQAVFKQPQNPLHLSTNAPNRNAPVPSTSSSSRPASASSNPPRPTTTTQSNSARPGSAASSHSSRPVSAASSHPSRPNPSTQSHHSSKSLTRLSPDELAQNTENVTVAKEYVLIRPEKPLSRSTSAMNDRQRTISTTGPIRPLAVSANSMPYVSSLSSGAAASIMPQRPQLPQFHSTQDTVLRRVALPGRQIDTSDRTNAPRPLITKPELPKLLGKPPSRSVPPTKPKVERVERFQSSETVPSRKQVVDVAPEEKAPTSKPLWGRSQSSKDGANAKPTQNKARSVEVTRGKLARKPSSRSLKGSSASQSTSTGHKVAKSDSATAQCVAQMADKLVEAAPADRSAPTALESNGSLFVPTVGTLSDEVAIQVSVTESEKNPRDDSPENVHAFEPTTTPPRKAFTQDLAKTPISSLLLAIERGFEMSPPSSPDPRLSNMGLTSSHLATPVPLYTRKSSLIEMAEADVNSESKREMKLQTDRRALDDIFCNQLL